ncbi:Protein stu1 [Penicillium malachiteum]|uniref:Protein stu1 n=1 Tax=Penicillium malachiteum TaxID=1324776 RepID=A0AAD6HP08_9EURO|nr:Protein stu1 [Penicillium malachiteum]
METKAAELLAAFKNPNLSVEAKVAHLTGIKSDIKQKNVPEGAISTIFETIRLALNSQHYSVCSGAFSTLGHFLKRLTIQDQQQWIVSQARNFYPVLTERLGDHKERIRAQSASIFTDLWPLANEEVEYYVLGQGLVGKNPRAKEMSLLWLSNMTKNHGLLFRQYVPSLVASLEDADSAVRDTAKVVVIDLFRTAPSRAKSDLQKQLVTRGVRKSIASAILSGIGLSSAEPETSNRPISRAERPISVMSRSHAMDMHDDGVFVNEAPSPVSNNSNVDSEPEPIKSRPGSRAHYDRPIASSSADAPARPKTPAAEPPTPRAPSHDDDGLEPLLVGSGRNVEDLVRDMLPWFDGRESEDNWMKREKNVILFRRLTRGNAPHEFSQAFVQATKTLLDGFFKVVNSLRTTLCTNGCLLIQDIARVCGPKIDSMVEIIMQNLIKLCASLKKIAAQNGTTTVDAVIGNVTFNIRILQHIYWASQDKNVQLRLCAAAWLKTLISRQAHHKSTVEHGGGLDLIDKSIRKGLADANPGVREATRGTYWTFSGVWPDRAEGIISDLDAKSRGLLEKDPANPNAAQKTATSTKGTGGGRSALKEAIAARKKAQMSARPESAQSAFADNQSSESAPKPAVRTVPTGAPLSSLSSAPMRPAMKPRRAEINRPATADPYARRPDRPDSRAQTARQSTLSPRSIRSKASTPSSKPINAPRIRPHESGTATTRGKPKKLDLSKSKSHGDLAAASRARSSSNESTNHQPSVQSHPADQTSAYDAPASPAPVVLESPPLSASRPPRHHDERIDTHRVSTPEPAAEPEPMALEDPMVDVAFPSSEPHPATPLRQSTMTPTPESVTKPQHEEVVIYEDPATPVATEMRTSRIDPVEHFTPTRSLRHSVEHVLDEETPVDTPVESTTPLRNPPAEVLQYHGRLSHDGSNEPQFPSPARRTPLRGSPSPTRSRGLATPSGTGPGRESLLRPESVAGSPVKTPNKENERAQPPQIAEYSATPRSAAKPGALEELPLNESAMRTVETRQLSVDPMCQSIGEESLRRSRKWAERHRSPSPRSKDPANAREMLHKALGRISTRTMDISGYRKLQGLFQYHGEEIVSREDDYYEVLNALLTELESAPTSRKDHDVKTQILATIRSMILRTSDLFHRYNVPAIASIIRARRHYESNSHFVTCLEEVAEQLACLVPVSICIQGVLQGLESEQDSQNDDSYRSIILGLSTIHQALSQGPSEISDEVLANVGSVLSRQLSHPRPGVRKQATELCTLLNLKFGLDRVQKVTPPAGEGSLNLLTYFMARRSQ